jgi:hypothetical protein
MCVMRAERLNLVAVCLQQFPATDPVASEHFKPRRHHELHQLAAGVRIRLHRVYLTVVSANVPAVQQPLVIHSQGDSTMPARTSREREQDKLGFSNLNWRRAVQPQPLIASK